MAASTSKLTVLEAFDINASGVDLDTPHSLKQTNEVGINQKFKEMLGKYLNKKMREMRRRSCKFAISVIAIQMAEIYMFDEPLSYLDVKQRLKAAQVIRSLLRPNRLSRQHRRVLRKLKHMHSIENGTGKTTFIRMLVSKSV
nr:hypothetical protein [Tanacetum cinerariifolium]